MKTVDAIYSRKSTRHYRNVRIERAVLQEILSAGIQAPSPKNDQPWKFLIVEEEEKKEAIANILEKQLEKVGERNAMTGIIRKDIESAFESVRILKEASTLIFVYLDTNIYDMHNDNLVWELNAADVECTHIMAIGAAIQNILLAATDKGIDSLWIGDILYAYNDMHKYLGREECLLAAVALGYASKNQSKIGRKSLSEVTTYF